MSLKTVNDGYYGDETRWFVGVVQSTNDPLTQGRVRVRIFGVHSANIKDIPDEALPWAQVVAPITHGGTSGLNGTPVGIKQYAQVFGIFLDGTFSASSRTGIYSKGGRPQSFSVGWTWA